MSDAVDQERARLDELVERYAIARANREMFTNEEKAARVVEDRAEAELFDALERLNLRQVRHRTYGLFTLNDLAWPKVTDAITAREWAEREGHGDLITLNSTRIAPYIRELIKEGGDLPPGIDVSFSRKINWRRQ